MKEQVVADSVIWIFVFTLLQNHMECGLQIVEINYLNTEHSLFTVLTPVSRSKNTCVQQSWSLYNCPTHTNVPNNKYHWTKTVTINNPSHQLQKSTHSYHFRLNHCQKMCIRDR